MARTFSPYELNHLRRYGLHPEAYLHDERPVEYITGKVIFCGHGLEVTSAVLIPRVETEELVGLAASNVEALAEKLARPLVVADVGCGSGAIGLSLGALPMADTVISHLYLSDISQPALEVAHRNERRLSSPSVPTTLLESDVLRGYPRQIKLDVVIANLPYIPQPRLASLPESVAKCEPNIALDGGADGFKVIRELLAQLPLYLNSEAVILLEVDDTHDHASLEQLISGSPLADSISWQVVRDSFGRERFVVIEYQAVS